MSGICLQINVSAGDVDYAAVTVPALIDAQRDQVDSVFVVMDACRPQKTPLVDPERRFPEPAYAERVERMLALVGEWQSSALIDRHLVLRPGAPEFAELAARYLRSSMRETHDYGGTAVMGYLAGFHYANARYVAHFDSDLLLHQAAGKRWIAAAIDALGRYPEAVAASPRPAPPWADGAERYSREQGRPARRVADGWLDDWYSTRCLLIDGERMAAELPWIQGRLRLEMTLRRWLSRGYPMSPEQLMFRRLGPRGRRRLVLADDGCWTLHPTRKGTDFLGLLPLLIDSVRAGTLPDAQRGHENFDLPVWERWRTGTFEETTA